MKNILCILLITVCLYSQVQGSCVIKGKNYDAGEHIVDCIRYTCHADGHMTALGCPAYQCAKQIGYRQTDLSKPYPDCCEGPICAE